MAKRQIPYRGYKEGGSAVADDLYHRIPGDKLTRFLPFCLAVENQQVMIAHWLKGSEWEEECLAMPTGQHDDYVDGTSLAYWHVTMFSEVAGEEVAAGEGDDDPYKAERRGRLWGGG